ncbi:MAG: hypothetical protein H7125_11380 [Proteobacteria bacterium]|nr:hypothetical protein [Burkholderiales bacterium]
MRLGYNQAETLVNWMVSDYVDFDPQQRDLFGQKFRALHAWHRRDQLPEYVRLLRETRSRAEDGLSREDVMWVMARGRGRLDAMVQQGADDAAEVLSTLTAAQVKELDASFIRANRKFMRDWAVGRPAAEQQRVRAERTITQVERFTGRLSREQNERVVALSNALPLTTDQRFAERQRRQRELTAALQSGRSRDELAGWFRQWAPNWERGRDEAYARTAKIALEQRTQMYVEIDQMLTPAQRRVALDRLQGYIDDFVALIGSDAAQRRAANQATK